MQSLLFVLLCVAAAVTQPTSHRLLSRVSLGRIINGHPAKIEDHPWQVRIFIYAPNTPRVLCGGSVISNSWVLTAGHCVVDGEVFELGFGSADLNNPAVEQFSRRKILHPLYNRQTLANDIALIKLQETLQFSDSIKAITLPKRADHYIGAKAIASGWGRTETGYLDQLNFAPLKIISNPVCSNYFVNMVRPSTVCASGFENESTCYGVSGGPLTVSEYGQTTLVGISSFVSVQSCETGRPAGFTRVSSFLPWISKNTGINSEIIVDGFI